ncbi:sigma-70 family RNA polymerase sigma factor [Streptomyces sp. NPDC127068]|uniref:sigma-70 family RNA polymerase sigma factor n=1 Tax=Streptomyces sp. NPDC127068 TaxID=3347127 RepID=UPI003656F156
MENGETDLISAARDGDPVAREALAVRYLPLLYNVVGRALNGHADVDDVVQETMLRAFEGLPELRDPDRFRSWIVAIALNRVRDRWASVRRLPDAPFAPTETPAPDFVDLMIWRLRLSGERKEVAVATRWLGPADREVLSLWWLEAVGELTRSDVSTALGLSRQHTAVRVQRVKGRLTVARSVVRALAERPGCPGLALLTDGWDGGSAPVWRHRLGRHVLGCPQCGRHTGDFMPLEGLLAGLGPLDLPAEASDRTSSTSAQAGTGPTHPDASSYGGVPSRKPSAGRGRYTALGVWPTVGLAATGALAASVLSLLVVPADPTSDGLARPWSGRVTPVIEGPPPPDALADPSFSEPGMGRPSRADRTAQREAPGRVGPSRSGPPSTGSSNCARRHGHTPGDGARTSPPHRTAREPRAAPVPPPGSPRPGPGPGVSTVAPTPPRRQQAAGTPGVRATCAHPRHGADEAERQR